MRLKQDLKTLWRFWKSLKEARKEGMAYVNAMFSSYLVTSQQQADIADYLAGKKHMKRYGRKGK